MPTVFVDDKIDLLAIKRVNYHTYGSVQTFLSLCKMERRHLLSLVEYLYLDFLTVYRRKSQF